MRLYRLLLRLLPAELRRSWGAEMAADVERRLREAPGPWARARIRAGALWDVVAVSVQERRRGGARVTRDGWGETVATVLRDLGRAVRSFLRVPGFTAVAVGTLALGIGATTAVFSIVHGVLLRPLAFPEPERLVSVWPEEGFNLAMARRAAELDVFQGLTGISIWTMTLTGEGEPEELDVARVTPGHFEVLRVPPLLGRTFREEEGLPGRGDVAVLSHGFWMRRFGGDSTVLGRRIRLAGADHETRTVIGVMPADLPWAVRPVDAWTTLNGDPAVSIGQDITWYVNWRIARLAPGVSREQAEARLAAFAREARAQSPGIIDPEGPDPTLPTLLDARVGGARRTLWLLMGAVGLVLLATCVNVANLLLARGEDRARDVALRRALGAGAGRVVGQLLSESLVLAAAGAVGGLALAHLGLRGLLAAFPDAFPRVDQVALDLPVLLFVMAVTLGAAILFGTLPARRAVRTAPGAALASARGAARRGEGRLQAGLVALQTAATVAVAAAAGLMARSLGELYAVDTGFEPRDRVVFRLSPSEARYAGEDARIAYYRDVYGRIAALPGVASVGGMQVLPLDGGNWSFPTYPEGVDVPEGTAVPTVNFRAVTPGFEEAMGTRLLRGRTLVPADQEGDGGAVLVNQALVDRFWPGSDGLGKELRVFDRSTAPARVVGVLENIRQHGLDRASRQEMYVPLGGRTYGALSLWTVVHAPGAEPGRVLAAARDAAWEVDPDVPIAAGQPWAALVRRAAGPTRFLATLLGAFGLVAVVLGAVGVYGVTAYAVARRLPEFGVRMALGAPAVAVLGSAVFRGLLPVVVGLAAGLTVTAAAAGLMESLVFGVPARDPLTLGAVTLLLGLAGAAATLAPAWRASRLDPATVLQAE